MLHSLTETRGAAAPRQSQPAEELCWRTPSSHSLGQKTSQTVTETGQTLQRSNLNFITLAGLLKQEPTYTALPACNGVQCHLWRKVFGWWLQSCGKCKAARSGPENDDLRGERRKLCLDPEIAQEQKLAPVRWMNWKKGMLFFFVAGNARKVQWYILGKTLKKWRMGDDCSWI